MERAGLKVAARAAMAWVVTLAAACGALVDSPDAFSLRPSGPESAACDGVCLDVESGRPDGAVDGEATEVAGPDPLAPWPMVGANPAHTGRVAITRSTMSGKLSRWKLLPGVPPSAGPAVDGKGTAYSTTTAGTLIAVGSTG